MFCPSSFWFLLSFRMDWAIWLRGPKWSRTGTQAKFRSELEIPFRKKLTLEKVFFWSYIKFVWMNLSDESNAIRVFSHLHCSKLSLKRSNRCVLDNELGPNLIWIFTDNRFHVTHCDCMTLDIFIMRLQTLRLDTSLPFYIWLRGRPIKLRLLSLIYRTGAVK